MTLARRDRILVLAWSLPDALRALEGRSSETRRLSPAVWQLCSTCDGQGQVTDRWSKASSCPTCHGAGRYRSDPYADGAPVSGADDVALPRLLSRVVPCDRCSSTGVIPGRWVGETGRVRCPTCDGTGSLTVPVAGPDDARRAAVVDLDSETWAFRGGDWDALDSSLEAMRCNGRRPLWRAFVVAYVEPPKGLTSYLDLPNEVVVNAEHALEHVEAMMPSRVRVPAEVVTAYSQRQERDRLAAAKRAERMGRDHRKREIRAALRLGRSTADVARLFAVSEATVRRADA